MGRRKFTPEEREAAKKRKVEQNTENQRLLRQQQKWHQSLCENSQNYANLTNYAASSSNSKNDQNIQSIDDPGGSTRCEIFGSEEVQLIDGQNVEHSNPLHNLNNIREHYIGSMDIACVHCNAKHFSMEKVQGKGSSFNDCCSHGAVTLEPLPFLPELELFFDPRHVKSTEFVKRIRICNNLFSFASFNANLVNFNIAGRPGPYCFKIQGQIYYQINTSLNPTKDEKPSYGQLFVIDSNEAHECCMSSSNVDLDSDLMKLIDELLRKHNIFVKSYEMMGIELKNQQRPDSDLQLIFSLKPGVDKRRYNFQRTNEVAAIFSTTADGEIPDSYVVIRNKETKVLQKVSSMDRNVEPWVYPLFYPYGCRGWHRNLLRTNSQKRISRSAYVKYRIAIREEFNAFLRGGRLFQQYIVDFYVKIEKDRMDYCRSHQKELRIESYKGLFDYLHEKATAGANLRTGKIIILPSTFIGSPRNMLQNYHDGMAIVRKYGKPDLFVTMTCNPNWNEIQENLLTGQQAYERPDLCTRVFNLKKNALIKKIVGGFFGRVAAHLHVIEFQKRGPHVHLLVTLNPQDKICNASMVDKYISAEIPDPDADKILHDIVIKNMIHGPCADWCLIESKCSKRYPKTFNETTTIDDDSYPCYRRRETGKTYKRSNTFIVDNRNVVPYCPELLQMFNCHMNVEIVSSIKSVKYLHKYFYKGHDAASVVICHHDTNENDTIDHDEIKQYLEARYVGPSEAAWRILGKPLHDKSHCITRLPVHLPNEHNLTIHTEPDDTEINNALNQATMLLDYFALNARDEEAKLFHYVEIPTYYTFQTEKVDGKKVSQWEKRKRRLNCIGRMYSVCTTQLELFHLRLLLLRVKGATSYEDLRTVDGQTEQTFTAACVSRGLIENDEEWMKAMQEAAVFMMPRQLRSLFVRILIHCGPINPDELWNEFKDAMSEDHNSVIKQECYRKAYNELNIILRDEGKSLGDFSQLLNLFELDESFSDVSNKTAEEYLGIGTQQFNKLNSKQREVAEIILNLALAKTDVVENVNSCYFIDGPGGSGKTFLYEALWHLLVGKNKNVCTMAFTGIAATLLPRGKTVHKIFKLPVPLLSDSSSNLKLNTKEAIYLKNVDVFIWDEAPMAPRYAIEIMDRTLRDIMNNNIPFGGKIVVLGGDFRQLLLVKVHATRSEMIDPSINRSLLWQNFVQFGLAENMRTLPEQIEFSEFLLKVGNGSLNDNEDNLNIAYFPENCLASAEVDIVEDLYGDVFPNKEYRKSVNFAILSARNVDVNEINERVVQLLDENTEKVYTSIDSVEKCENDGLEHILTTEYLNSLCPSGLPPYELKLRVNSVIMIIRNLNVSEGLCTGTRLLILEMSNNILRCEILIGDKKGDIVFLNRITLCCEGEYPFTFKRRQFPVKLAFATTINKSQGQTFEKIGIDLRKQVFNHGQLYVALSRVGSWNSLRIYRDHSLHSEVIKNFVYEELYL